MRSVSADHIFLIISPNEFPKDVFKHCVKSELFWSVFYGIQSKCRKIRTRKTPYLDNLYAVKANTNRIVLLHKTDGNQTLAIFRSLLNLGWKVNSKRKSFSNATHYNLFSNHVIIFIAPFYRFALHNKWIFP